MNPKHEQLLKALHAIYGDDDITAKSIGTRLVGGALQDPANVALLQVIVALRGRNLDPRKVGRLLEKVVRGGRIGDLELRWDGEGRPGKARRYYLKDYAAKPAGPPPPDLWAEARAAEEKFNSLPPSKAIPAAIAAINRYERKKTRQQREADKANVIDDEFAKAVRANLRRMKCGKDGRPEAVEDELPPPATAAVVDDKPVPTASPPKPDGPWRQPTKAELIARHLAVSSLQGAAVHYSHMPLRQIGFSDPDGIEPINPQVGPRWSQKL